VKDWSIYERAEGNGTLWVGEHAGPHGIDTRLSGATRGVLLTRIRLWAEYRKANGNADHLQAPISLRAL
jgi:hypothetical protein